MQFIPWQYRSSLWGGRRFFFFFFDSFFLKYYFIFRNSIFQGFLSLGNSFFIWFLLNSVSITAAHRLVSYNSSSEIISGIIYHLSFLDKHTNMFFLISIIFSSKNCGCYIGVEEKLVSIWRGIVWSTISTDKENTIRYY